MSLKDYTKAEVVELKEAIEKLLTGKLTPGRKVFLDNFLVDVNKKLEGMADGNE